MQKLGLKVALIFLPLMALVVATNFFVDPLRLYHAKFEEDFARILDAGLNVGNPTNYDEGLTQKIRITNAKTVPDIVVIGSSRSMQIGTNIFPGAHVINSSVSDASLWDCLGIVFDYDRKGSMPGMVILGVEPWWLNTRYGQGKWFFLQGDALAMMLKLKVPCWDVGVPSIPLEISNLFSFSYFQLALGRLFDHQSYEETFFPTADERSNFSIRLKDGRISASTTLYQRTVEEINENAERDLSNCAGKECNFYTPDNGAETILERLVGYLQGKGVDVLFFLPPYHPIFYQHFLASGQNKVIVDEENYYRDFARRHHLKLLGSYDPFKLGLSGQNFYDGYHPTRETVESIFMHAYQR